MTKRKISIVILYKAGGEEVLVNQVHYFLVKPKDICNGILVHSM